MQLCVCVALNWSAAGETALLCAVRDLPDEHDVALRLLEMRASECCTTTILTVADPTHPVVCGLSPMRLALGSGSRATAEAMLRVLGADDPRAAMLRAVEEDSGVGYAKSC